MLDWQLIAGVPRPYRVTIEPDDAVNVVWHDDELRVAALRSIQNLRYTLPADAFGGLLVGGLPVEAAAGDAWFAELFVVASDGEAGVDVIQRLGRQASITVGAREPILAAVGATVRSGANTTGG